MGKTLYHGFGYKVVGRGRRFSAAGGNATDYMASIAGVGFA